MLRKNQNKGHNKTLMDVMFALVERTSRIWIPSYHKQKTQRLSKLLARRLYSRSSIEGVTRLAAEAALLFI